MPKLASVLEYIKQRISSITWRFLLFDSVIYGLFTPAIYLLSYIASFFVPAFSLELTTVVTMCLSSPAMLFCIFIVAHILPLNYRPEEYNKSIAKITLIRWKLKLGWGKFCVIQEMEIDNNPWRYFRLAKLSKSKKKYYDDPEIAARDMWIGGYAYVGTDLNYMYTILIKGRKYDLPRSITITPSDIKEHIEQCLEIDESFYGNSD